MGALSYRGGMEQFSTDEDDTDLPQWERELDEWTLREIRAQEGHVRARTVGRDFGITAQRVRSIWDEPQ